MRASLCLGMALQLALEIARGGRVEHHYAVAVRRVVHRGSGDCAVEDGLVCLAGRDDEDVDRRKVVVASKTHLGLNRASAVVEDDPERVDGCERGRQHR